MALTSKDLGLLSYEKALAMQLQIARSKSEEYILLLEHPPVITMGKNCSTEGLLATYKQLCQQEVSLISTDRGGQITAHMPGQLVCYPILNLRKRKLGPRSYIYLLETAILRLLTKYNIPATRINNYPGIFVENKKIASIGIRINNGFSYHGFAINICNSLNLFDIIIPCGLKNLQTTSMVTFLGYKPSFLQIKSEMKDIVLKLFS